MNSKLLLAKGITLLYRESQLPMPHENSSMLIREMLTAIKLPEVAIGLDHDRDILEALRNTAIAMCDAPPDHVYEAAEVLQRIKVNTGEDVDLYEAFRTGIEAEMTEAALKKNCLNIKRTLTNHFKEAKVQEIIGKAAYTIKFQREKVTDMKKFVAQISSELEPYMVDALVKDPAVVSEVNMDDLDDVENIFSSVQDQVSGGSILRTGSQGINRMLDGGFRRGEQWVFGALQHNYKTGFSLTVFKQVALYNVPLLTDPKKKPMLLRISFEDSLELNFQFLYSTLKENETGSPTQLEGVSAKEMARYVQKALGVNGWHTHFMYVNPSLWTYRDICNKIIELESDGYEIHLCMLDYLLKVPTTGCDQGPHGHDIRNMYERLRNFMSSRGICMITPHQLSTDAKMKRREGSLDLVKQLVGGGYYAGSKQIDQVVDGEIFFNIETVNGDAYLTCQRGKHRKIKQTPLEYQYCVLPFQKDGSILDDVGKADTTRKRPGGGPVGSGEETPFWDFEEQR